MTAREHPDVARVRVGASSAHALDLIDRIVRGDACPVIALPIWRDSMRRAPCFRQALESGRTLLVVRTAAVAAVNAESIDAA